MKNFIIASFVLLMAFSCNSGHKAERIRSDFDRIFKEVKSEFAPDRRVKTFEAQIGIPEQGGKVILRGSTTEREAKDTLIKRLRNNGIEVLDSMVTLPDPALDGKIFGITALSVINLRYGPDFSNEPATQTLLGTPLKILEKTGGWSRVMTPEGYIAWVTSGSLEEMQEAQYEEWLLSPRLIITAHYTIFRDAPSPGGGVVMDGVMGGIVQTRGIAGRYYKVILPGGKSAYLLVQDAVPLDKWIASLDPSPENIVKTAKQFTGFPYMWAGTSPKAMDCSGFTKTVYLMNGIILERDASQQGLTGDSISIANGFDSLRGGDLLFFGTKASEGKKERISHVGIYIGSGEFIHSSTSVRISSLLPEAANWYEGTGRLLRARRILTRTDAEEGIVSVKNHPWYFKR